MDYQELKLLEADLWEAADQLRANSKLTASEYSMPVLGLIFLRHATTRFHALLPDIEKAIPARATGALREDRIKLGFQGKAAIYLVPDRKPRFSEPPVLLIQSQLRRRDAEREISESSDASDGRLPAFRHCSDESSSAAWFATAEIENSSGLRCMFVRPAYSLGLLLAQNCTQALNVARDDCQRDVSLEPDDPMIPA